MIVKALESNIPDIIELLQSNNLPVEDISYNRQEFWIYKAEHEIRAVCGIEQYGKYALLRSMAVKKEYQKQGIGSELYRNVLEAAGSLGVTCLFLLTTTAREYFSKHGWMSVSRMAVPSGLHQSKEFSSICPKSADCMMLVLGEANNKKAFSIYNEGFNCAQAVLSASAEKLHLPENIALKMTSGLAAGIGFKGSVCGAVLGAYLAIGLKYGREKSDDDLAKETTYLKMREFDKQFILNHQSIYCRELLKGNVSNENELDEIIEQGYFEKACPVFVHTASNILNEIL